MRDPVVVGGRYELGELLGRGGMAEVRKGIDTRLGRAVAVKRLRTDLASDSTFQARFRREAQSSASLNHPSIVAVYDTGEEWSEDEGPGGAGVAQPYIVMEYVAGRTLRDILKEGRKILPERALEITAGVLSALDYSHRAGIIHRDIKPGNVMLTPTGDVKVMDFGIARAISDASASMTQTAAVVGTAQYLSPEQARGETVDSRSDVYSTGCLLYELLTGRPPFLGDSPVAVAYQHVREPAQPPSDFDTEIPPEIDAIVMKSLAKRVEDRYQSAAAMRSDIDRYIAGRPIQAPIAGAAATTMLPSQSAEQPRQPAFPSQHAGPSAYSEQTYAGQPAATSTTGALPPVDRGEPERSRTGLYVFLALLLVVLVVAGYFLIPKLFPPDDETVPVPRLVGMTEAQAEAALADAQLVEGDVDYQESEDGDRDRVIDQSPGEGEVLPPDSEVDYTVSTGAPMVSVPPIIGLPREQARVQLEQAGLEARFQTEESDEPRGQVLSSTPAPGESVPEQTVVTLSVSDGPSKVPGVLGRTQERAESILRDAGFEVFVTEDGSSTEPKGTVVGQNPSPGSEADSGSTVTIVVSTFEEPTPTPTPTPPVPTETPTIPPTATPQR